MAKKSTAAPAANIDNDLFPSAAERQEAEALWNEGGEANDAGQPIGTFVVEIVDAQLGRSTSSDRLQIHYMLRIVGGDSDGVELNKYDGLGSGQQASISRNQLERLGATKDELSFARLPATLQGLVGQKAQIKTKRNNNFYNIYFQKLLDGATAQVGSTRAGAPPARTPAVAGKSRRSF